MLGRRGARRRELAPKVLAIVADLLETKGMPSEVRLDEPLNTEGLGLDSIAQLEILQAIESQCEVHIPDRYWGKDRPRTINDILDIIAR